MIHTVKEKVSDKKILPLTALTFLMRFFIAVHRPSRYGGENSTSYGQMDNYLIIIIILVN